MPSRKSKKNAFEIHSALTISERERADRLRVQRTLDAGQQASVERIGYGEEHAPSALPQVPLCPGCALVLTIFCEANIAVPLLKTRKPYLEV